MGSNDDKTILAAKKSSAPTSTLSETIVHVENALDGLRTLAAAGDESHMLDVGATGKTAASDDQSKCMDALRIDAEQFCIKCIGVSQKQMQSLELLETIEHIAAATSTNDTSAAAVSRMSELQAIIHDGADKIQNYAYIMRCISSAAFPSCLPHALFEAASKLSTNKSACTEPGAAAFLETASMIS